MIINPCGDLGDLGTLFKSTLLITNLYRHIDTVLCLLLGRESFL